MESDMGHPEIQVTRMRLLWTVYLLTSIIYLLAGAIHLDEGAYMYSANAVYNGQLLYRDFFFLQPPLHSYIFGLVQVLFHGLLFGRLTSILLGIGSTVFLMRLAGKLDGQNGQTGSPGIVLALMAMSPFQIYFFTITRLYALTAFFISAGCYYVFRHRKPGIGDILPGTVFLSLAMGTRLTVLPLFVLVMIYVLFRADTVRDRFLPVIVSAVVLGAVYIPFVLAAGPERIWFNLLGMNLSLHSHNLSANLIQKARATRQLLRFYFVPWLLFVPIVFDGIQSLKDHGSRRFLKSAVSPRGFLWIITLVMLFVHSTAKLYQVSYQTIVMPLFFCLLAVEWRKKFLSFNASSRRVSAIAFKVLFVISILAYGRTSISIVDGKPALFALWDQARFIREHTKPGDMIFSADSALAVVEANRDVLKGMAASDLFAGWSTEKCREYNVLNFPIMEAYVREQAGAMLIYGDLSFNLSLPYLEPVSKDQRNHLMKHIDRQYETVRSFPNLTLPGTQTHYCLPRRNPPEMPAQFLLFGIDAAAWDVLLPLCRQGLLPNIDRARKAGYATDMNTLDPTVSVMLWTTIATGMLPEHHGINNWLSEGMDTSGQLAITSDRRRVPAFWNIIDDRKMLIANWWASWPVEAVNGVMLSNRAHFPELDHTVYPPELQPEISRQPRVSREQLEQELTDLNPENQSIRLSEFFARQLQKDRFYLDTFQMMLSRDQYDIAAVFIRGIDILEHEYLRDVRSDVSTIPDIPREQHGIVKAYYRYVDRWLGRFMETMGPDTGIILVSDHGMDPVVELPPLIEGLDLNKLLKAMERAGGGGLNYQGFTDNKSYPPGMQRGVAWTGNGNAPRDESVQLVRHLRSLTCDNRPLFRTVELKDNSHEIIYLELDPAPQFKSVIRFRGAEIPVMSVTGMIIHPRSGQHWHAPDGIFLAAGPGIRTTDTPSPMGILDILPTWLVWTGTPIATDLDGRPVLDLFTDRFLAAHPPAQIDTYGPRSETQSVDAPEAVEDSIRSELESLGYIQVE